MFALAALATLATATQAPAPAPLFTAFKAACFNIDSEDGASSFAAIAPAAKTAGWVEVAEADADPRIAAIIGKGREAMAKEEPDATLSGQLFRQRFDGRDVYLASSRYVSKEGYWGNGCRVYDLDAPASPSAVTLSDWVGQGPTGTQSSGNAVKLLWEPWQTGVSLEITYVPRDNPLGATYGIQGLILVSQAIGGF